MSTVLAQVAVADRTNEIRQMDDLIKELALSGLVVTADAMHTQVATAEAIIEASGDYLMVVKKKPADTQAGNRTGFRNHHTGRHHHAGEFNNHARFAHRNTSHRGF